MKESNSDLNLGKLAHIFKTSFQLILSDRSKDGHNILVKRKIRDELFGSKGNTYTTNMIESKQYFSCIRLKCTRIFSHRGSSEIL